MSVAKTTTIRATSRASVKIGESYYTVEYQEERPLPDTDIDDAQLAEERAVLWDVCNTEVDNQIQDIINMYADNKRSAKK